MYEYLKGKITYADSQKAIIEINGVGYKVFIPASSYLALCSKEEVTLYTSFIVKEDSQSLYGFLTKDQRDIFEILISVSGVGAKTANLLLGHIDLESLNLAISTADVRLLSKIPNIGKKTAERLIVELKDKFKNLNLKGNMTFTKSSSLANDAMNALINLGYNPHKAQIAVKSVMDGNEEDLELGILITKSLQKI